MPLGGLTCEGLRKACKVKRKPVCDLETMALGDTDRVYATWLQSNPTKAPKESALLRGSRRTIKPRRPNRHIIVLGSGVVAYQTALSLRMSRELRDCQVTLMPDQPRNEGNKHSKHNLSYASSKTDGVWRPHADGFYANVRDASSTIKAFEKRTYEYWSSIMPKDAFLYPSAGEAARRHHGLSVTTCKHYRGEGHADMSNGECPGLWWSNFVDSFQTVNLASQREKRSADEMKKVPDNATVGVQYNTFVFDPDTYLEGRARMAADFGVRIMEYRQLVMDNRDTDLVQSIKRNLHFQLDREDDFDERALRWIANPFRMRNRDPVNNDSVDIIVNCSEIAGTIFFKDEAKRNFVRETIAICGVASSARVFDRSPDEIYHVLPRPAKGVTVFGRCQSDESDFNPIRMNPRYESEILHAMEEHNLANELFADRFFKVTTESQCTSKSKNNRSTCRGLLKRKESAELLDSGFHLGRFGGPRVEFDCRGSIAQTLLFHNYGHANGGFQSSVGAAERITRLVRQQLFPSENSKSNAVVQSSE